MVPKVRPDGVRVHRILLDEDRRTEVLILELLHSSVRYKEVWTLARRLRKVVENRERPRREVSGTVVFHPRHSADRHIRRLVRPDGLSWKEALLPSPDAGCCDAIRRGRGLSGPVPVPAEDFSALSPQENRGRRSESF